MASCLWTFLTATTTGFESDVDTISGVALRVFGDGAGADAAPIPTVPGEAGNGRLFASANLYNEFSTDKVTELAHTSGNPASLSFQWKPLVDYAGGLAGSSMLGFHLIGYNMAGSVALYAIDVYITSNATAGLYDFRIALTGFFVPVTTFNFLSVAMTIRDWNAIEITHNGTDTLTLVVNGSTEGTITPTTFPMPTTQRGALIFAKDASTTGALYGVIDTVALTT